MLRLNKKSIKVTAHLFTGNFKDSETKKKEKKKKTET